MSLIRASTRFCQYFELQSMEHLPLHDINDTADKTNTNTTNFSARHRYELISVDFQITCSIYSNDASVKHKENKKTYQLCIRIKVLTPMSLPPFLWDIGKQYRPRCDAAERGVPSGSILFGSRNFIEN